MAVHHSTVIALHRTHHARLSVACAAALFAAVQDDDYFHRIPEPTEDELDMLDLAFGLTET